MKHHTFEILCVVLMLAGLVFFFYAMRQIAQRDYVASALLAVIGISSLHVGTYLARLALIARK